MPKGTWPASARVLTTTDLLWYSGDDVLNLPLLSLGATGFVSVIGHFVAPALVAMREAFLAGDTRDAREPCTSHSAGHRCDLRHPGGHDRQGGLGAAGLPAGPSACPLVAATVDQVDGVITALEAISG